MADKSTCSTCKGSGYIDALVSQHDDKKETVKCPSCGGKGEINYMSEEDERDYWADYW